MKFVQRLQRLTAWVCLLTGLATSAHAQQSWPEEVPVRNKYTCKEVQVPMRDGLKLAADLYLPEGQGPFPVILERTPYNKNNCRFTHGVYFAERGYAVLIQDVRGRYRSPGGFYQYRDEGWGRRQDGYDTIEWAGTQPWSTGKVGTMGLSYTCFNQNMTAVTQPPHLKAMFCADSASNWYVDHRYPGGALHMAGMDWFFTQGEAAKPIQENVPDQGGYKGDGNSWMDWHHRRIERSQGFWESWQSDNMADHFNNTTYNNYWKQFAPDEHVEKFQVPAYYMSGWYDRYPHSVTKMYNLLKTKGGTAAAREGVRLVIGPWVHGGGIVMDSKIGDLDFGPEARMGYAALRLKWFDYHLRGIDNGIMKEPPVKIFVMGLNKWRGENEWPIKRAIQTKFYLRAEKSGSIQSQNDGSLMKQPPTAAEKPDTYRYDPKMPTPTIGGDMFVEPMGARDHRPSDMTGLTFTTAPFDESVEISGPSTVDLYVSSSADDTDFVVTLIDVHPDGYAQTLRESIQRASRRESLENPTPIVPKRVYKLTIPVHPISNQFNKGHRLRLTVASSSFPKYMPSHNQFMQNNEDAPWNEALNTIYHDAQRPSVLTVPVIPR
jgi:putative CocE/NonD family hydrolase